MGNQGGGKGRKIGRNKVKCAKYAAQGRKQKNAEAKEARRVKGFRTPEQRAAAKARKAEA